MMIVYSATKQQIVNESIALLPCAYLHNMKARDAINDDGSLWLIAENSVEQIGCIHTYQPLDLPVVSFEQAKPYQGYVPIFDLEVAAQNNEWVQLLEHINTTQGMFVTRVVGESMNKRIINGSWCLFKANPGGSRNGKIVLVQHRDIEDPDHGGTYTVKTYHGEKIEEDGVLVNQRIVLKLETNAYGYSPIVIEDDGEELVVVGELLVVL